MSYIAHWTRYSSSADRVINVSTSPRYKNYESAEVWVHALPGFRQLSFDLGSTNDPATVALWRKDRGSIKDKTAVIDFVYINRVKD